MTKSNVYTRTGDNGTTSLVGGTRVAKDSPRLEAYGTVDELNSWLGLIACSRHISADDKSLLTEVQNRLFDIGSMLATEPESHWQPEPLADDAAAVIEQAIDRLDSTIPAHNRFILPGGCEDAARAHIARCVARRAERRIITLAETAPVASPIIRYINRLSDYLFVLARAINYNCGSPEIFWEKKC